MIGACSTRGTYRDVWQIPGAANIERWKIAPSPMTGGSPPGKAPAGPPTATPDADPLFAALGNVRPSHPSGGRTVLRAGGGLPRKGVYDWRV